jgi:malate dehydrogenase (oxaloacetate-decarboxylating)
LQEVIENVRPSVLIGASGQANLFTEQLVRTMYQHCPHPIIFPLSNPSSQVEAMPADVIKWTDGDAILATGSPFPPVSYKGQTYRIPQCNNSYVFPGLGLGLLAVDANRVSDETLAKASETLAALSPLAEGKAGDLLPPLTEIAEISKKIAFSVAKVAQQQGFALEMSDKRLLRKIEDLFWLPEYRSYRRCSV